ncbi:uncharacterized protein [Dermacentor andersoni]|uniref:uncharacterized protein isoform X3 n=1 Tax=Dermacentor andersoni TaxID=34620 RepID=UPI003B3AEEBA
MCELEPIPLMLEPMKDPKLISLVCKARKGQGVHNYIKSVCVPSPAYQLSLMRQYYPHQVLKITTVNYVLEDNPEFRLRLWNANVIVKEINLTLKDGDVGVDYQTFKRKEEYDDEIILDTKVDLNVNHKVHLKKGEYIVASVSCKMSEKTTCVNYRECTSIGTLQFEFNGVELVTYPMELKYLNVLFRALKMYGLKDRTSAREVHQEYSNVSESFALFTMQKMYDVAAVFYCQVGTSFKGHLLKKAKKTKLHSHSVISCALRVLSEMQVNHKDNEGTLTNTTRRPPPLFVGIHGGIWLQTHCTPSHISGPHHIGHIHAAVTCVFFFRGIFVGGTINTEGMDQQSATRTHSTGQHESNVDDTGVT